MPKKVKISRGSAENGEEHLEFAEAAGWKACYDSRRELYTAESFLAGYYDLYEINKEIYKRLTTEHLSRYDAQSLINTGRHLYKSVSDRNSSYDVAIDENYAELCPWAQVQSAGELWDRTLTDLAVAVFDSEKQNRKQRRKQTD